ncbi:MAG: NADH-quinone oxidoreductase subunit C [Chloroflexi bacterium]|nr:NADH-quinone oxidoreductase subunit C [Chloroflexota bacterium]
MRLHAALPDDDNPAVASVVAVWPTADWFEREVYDLFGIRFVGHPNLRRIILSDDWEGHPLRKDYPIGLEDVAFTHTVGRVQPQQVDLP